MRPKVKQLVVAFLICNRTRGSCSFNSVNLFLRSFDQVLALVEGIRMSVIAIERPDHVEARKADFLHVIKKRKCVSTTHDFVCVIDDAAATLFSKRAVIKWHALCKNFAEQYASNSRDTILPFSGIGCNLHLFHQKQWWGTVEVEFEFVLAMKCV